MNILAHIGRATLALCEEVGRVTLFTRDGLLHGLAPKYYLRQIADQMLKIGYFSLPVVGLTAFFTGGALALQIYLGSSRFNAESLVASIVALGITRELGPVLAGLMVAGRVGASIAAELGTMRVTEQIDALTTLSTNPFKYLIAPRLIAGLTMLPVLVAVVAVGAVPSIARSTVVAVFPVGGVGSLWRKRGLGSHQPLSRRFPPRTSWLARKAPSARAVETTARRSAAAIRRNLP